MVNAKIPKLMPYSGSYWANNLNIYRVEFHINMKFPLLFSTYTAGTEFKNFNSASVFLYVPH